MPDGGTSLADNYLTKVNGNTFTWQSVERSLNRQLLPDTAEVSVQRVSEVTTMPSGLQPGCRGRTLLQSTNKRTREGSSRC